MTRMLRNDCKSIGRRLGGRSGPGPRAGGHLTVTNRTQARRAGRAGRPRRAWSVHAHPSHRRLPSSRPPQPARDMQCRAAPRRAAPPAAAAPPCPPAPCRSGPPSWHHAPERSDSTKPLSALTRLAGPAALLHSAGRRSVPSVCIPSRLPAGRRPRAAAAVVRAGLHAETRTAARTRRTRGPGRGVNGAAPAHGPRALLPAQRRACRLTGPAPYIHTYIHICIYTYMYISLSPSPSPPSLLA